MFNFNVQDLLYKYDENITYNQIFDELKDYILKNEINNNNISIISNKITDIRNLEFYARNKYNLNIERTFVTKEECEELSKKYRDEKILNRKLIEMTRNRKLNFKLNKSNLKMSTIHSFKGWESDTLILIIDNDEKDTDEKKITPELIYTAITRCTTNLIIYNRGNKKYHNFFKDNMEDLSKYREYAILSKKSF